MFDLHRLQKLVRWRPICIPTPSVSNWPEVRIDWSVRVTLIQMRGSTCAHISLQDQSTTGNMTLMDTQIWSMRIIFIQIWGPTHVHTYRYEINPPLAIWPWWSYSSGQRGMEDYVRSIMSSTGYSNLISTDSLIQIREFICAHYTIQDRSTTGHMTLMDTQIWSPWITLMQYKYTWFVHSYYMRSTHH